MSNPVEPNVGFCISESMRISEFSIELEDFDSSFWVKRIKGKSWFILPEGCYMRAPKEMCNTDFSNFFIKILKLSWEIIRAISSVLSRAAKELDIRNKNLRNILNFFLRNIENSKRFRRYILKHVKRWPFLGPENP